LIVVTEMLYEKDKKLKEFMIAYGMKCGSYWLSWIVVSIVMNVYVAVTIVSLAKMVGWEVFKNVPYVLMLNFYMSTSFGMNTLGFFLSSICTSRKSGYTVSYAFLLISFVF
jgi:ABC-2 family transporter protein